MRVNIFYLLLLLVFSHFCYAENTVVSLNRSFTQNTLHIKPVLNFKTSKDIKEAIDNGIRLYIIAKAHLYESNPWWIDNVIESKKINLEVSYFTLSELYVAKNLNSGKQIAFNSYQQLWKDLEKLIVFDFNQKNNNNLWVKSRIMLDKAALPTAMQLPVLFNPEWRINTPWFAQEIKPK